MRRIGALLVLLGCAAAADAQQLRGAYAGAALGYFTYEEDGENLGFPISDGAGGYRVLGGYQFNSAYALEAVWGRSGQFSETFRAVDSSGNPGPLELGGEYEISTLRFIAFAPLSNFGMFGGAGYYDAKLDLFGRFESVQGIRTRSAEGADDGLTVVGGFQFEFTRFALRGEFEWFDADNGVDAQSVNVTGLLRF